MVAHTFNASTKGPEGSLCVQGQQVLPSQFQAVVLSPPNSSII